MPAQTGNKVDLDVLAQSMAAGFYFLTLEGSKGENQTYRIAKK